MVLLSWRAVGRHWDRTLGLQAPGALAEDGLELRGVGQLAHAQPLEELDEDVELVGQGGDVRAQRVLLLGDEEDGGEGREAGAAPHPRVQVVGLELAENVGGLARRHELVAALGHRQVVVPWFFLNRVFIYFNILSNLDK